MVELVRPEHDALPCLKSGGELLTPSTACSLRRARRFSALAKGPRDWALRLWTLASPFDVEDLSDEPSRRTDWPVVLPGIC